jgi:hypothetical protein
VPVTASYLPVSKPRHPWDYFHLNSIQQLGDGNLLVSGRNTSALYEVDYRTGNVVWELGGKNSNFAMGPGTHTAFQHDPRLHPGDLLTVFDNGAWPQVHRQSRVLIERVDARHMRVSLIRQLDHSPHVLSNFEGSVQILQSGNIFVGWGAQPYFSEYGKKGKQIYDGRFVGGNSSYRAFRFRWNAQPSNAPALAVVKGRRRSTRIYASWNGATGVVAWRVLAGSNPGALRPIATARKGGFETTIPVRSSARYFAVQAISSSRKVLATSLPARG